MMFNHDREIDFTGYRLYDMTRKTETLRRRYLRPRSLHCHSILSLFRMLWPYIVLVIFWDVFSRR